MIQLSKIADEKRDGGPMECWLLHGGVGMAADWRATAKRLAGRAISTRAVDLWRFLESGPIGMPDFGKTLNVEAGGEVFRGTGRALLGYSMGGRLALHALLEKNHPWQAAVIVSAHPGLESEDERSARRTNDTQWAGRAFTSDWRQFLEAWEKQPVLAGASARDPQAGAGLVSRRQEIARSFVDWSLGAQQPLWERLREIDVPVLWVVGERDEKFCALAERAVSLIPKVRLAIAPEAGHRVPWAAEEWFASQVADFVNLGA
ncbi:alpha/beta fold hydrolase [Luteolibacter pohnpeiensis]|uniref:Alpha/beta fold hydrolase n=1 Tax=Luteolibacter pohnpeiensis TaxID=454153 RepID=A0A934VVS9_9BACT|nr:alpha/beta fold hydrolase [Luteolibacter pohnpeiensis]MBK1882530.1 alpha/beta fold hydrolase [Luteolibacter pohnpeiensis]